MGGSHRPALDPAVDAEGYGKRAGPTVPGSQRGTGRVSGFSDPRGQPWVRGRWPSRTRTGTTTITHRGAPGPGEAQVSAWLFTRDVRKGAPCFRSCKDGLCLFMAGPRPYALGSAGAIKISDAALMNLMAGMANDRSEPLRSYAECRYTVSEFLTPPGEARGHQRFFPNRESLPVDRRTGASNAVGSEETSFRV